MDSPASAPQVVLKPHPESVRRARDLVSRVLSSSVDAETAEDAAVVMSELVTNAVIHANTPVTVGLTLLPGGGARIEVGDASPWPPTPRDAAPDAPGGRGLYLVEVLAEQWGVSPTPDGKTVWAEVTPGHSAAPSLGTHRRAAAQ